MTNEQTYYYVLFEQKKPHLNSWICNLFLQAKMELNDGNLLTLSDYLLKTLSPDASVRKPGLSTVT
jgi:hypothetical protein